MSFNSDKFQSINPRVLRLSTDSSVKTARCAYDCHSLPAPLLSLLSLPPVHSSWLSNRHFRDMPVGTTPISTRGDGAGMDYVNDRIFLLLMLFTLCRLNQKFSFLLFHFDHNTRLCRLSRSGSFDNTIASRQKTGNYSPPSLRTHFLNFS